MYLKHTVERSIYSRISGASEEFAEDSGELGLTIDVLLRDQWMAISLAWMKKIFARLFPGDRSILHSHLGLQFYSEVLRKKNLSQMERELQSLDAFLGDLKKDYGYQAEELEYGPGLFAPYFVKDKE